jgi:hypothetical protein
MDKDIALALEMWREKNADPRKWASLEFIQFQYSRIVRMDWGHRKFDGRKEVAIASRYFYMDGEMAEVRWHDTAHS